MQPSIPDKEGADSVPRNLGGRTTGAMLAILLRIAHPLSTWPSPGRNCGDGSSSQNDVRVSGSFIENFLRGMQELGYIEGR